MVFNQATVLPIIRLLCVYVKWFCFLEKHLYPARQALKKGNKKGQLTCSFSKDIFLANKIAIVICKMLYRIMVYKFCRQDLILYVTKYWRGRGRNTTIHSQIFTYQNSTTKLKNVCRQCNFYYQKYMSIHQHFATYSNTPAQLHAYILLDPKNTWPARIVADPIRFGMLKSHWSVFKNSCATLEPCYAHV